MEGKGEGEKETFPCVIALRVAHAAMEKERCPIRGDREHFVAKETPISLFRALLSPCSSPFLNPR